MQRCFLTSPIFHIREPTIFNGLCLASLCTSEQQIKFGERANTNTGMPCQIKVMPEASLSDREVRELFIYFFFNDTATTEIYTLSLHDALPIWQRQTKVVEAATNTAQVSSSNLPDDALMIDERRTFGHHQRSEEHTSELQSPDHLVCRLLLEKKKIIHII